MNIYSQTIPGMPGKRPIRNIDKDCSRMSRLALHRCFFGNAWRPGVMSSHEFGEVVRHGLSERRLCYLTVAIEAKSIRGAADKLNIEPSVVSRQIQILERELDTVL